MKYAVILKRAKKHNKISTKRLTFLSLDDAAHYESNIKLHDPKNPEISDMKYVHKELEEFKRECIYNLGVNTRIRYNVED